MTADFNYSDHVCFIPLRHLESAALKFFPWEDCRSCWAGTSTGSFWLLRSSLR